jgi:hypothetical protein
MISELILHSRLRVSQLRLKRQAIAIWSHLQIMTQRSDLIMLSSRSLESRTLRVILRTRHGGFLGGAALTRESCSHIGIQKFSIAKE